MSLTRTLKLISGALLASTLVLQGASQHASAQGNDFITAIGGGKKAQEGEYPWQVRLFYNQDDPDGYCGGSIIHRRWVLTAAHCVADLDGGNDIEDADLVDAPPEETPRPQIGYGSTKRSELVRVDIERVIVHPDYGYQSGSDIALLKVAEDLPGNTIIQLPGKNDRVETGVPVVVTGWGATVDTSLDPSITILFNMLQDSLKERPISVSMLRSALKQANPNMPEDLLGVEIKVLDLQACANRYAQLNDPNSLISESEICAGEPGSGKDSCYGDSGGPLVARGPEGAPQLVGVVSWGYKCGHPLFPGVYASTSHFADWITASMSQ